MKLEPRISSCTKFNSNWTQDFDIKPDAIILVDGERENIFELIDTGKDFMSRKDISSTYFNANN